MKSAALAESVKAPQTAFNNVYLIHARIDAPLKMSGDECLARFRLQLKATNNTALRNFNKLDNNFKFVVLTLANRLEPSSFKPDEIGKPFEFFDQARRLLIIRSMNEITRWGSLLPARFSKHDCYLAE
ncbi:Uncharacterised protein [Buttiauxella agrestis]|uniref:Uncharacterized protein n=1 Tax=Buttiauxella agrestis TaxID=82977 RepID=A0A381CC56_9ENTR|nr:hypothetical protein [Buttiauxella agrestis]SUW65452.1 Uncharacterised protein [Buttiauxella agrestis]